MTEKADIEQQAAPADELQSGLEVGGYIIDRKIGEGGMGVVYGAHHPRIGKRVAIKVLSPAFSGDPATVERFEQEARLVNEIKHPNIVDVFQFGELPDGRTYFVMEWLEGESLSQRLEQGPMSARETMDVMDAMCDALEAAHEKGVIHRDLKSDNVFIVPMRKEKKVKLLDFGLAKLAGRNADPTSVHKTKDGIVVGTPAYMSPEQARGKSVDHRTDIYALGCLGYKMVTGRLPFSADNAMDLIVKQLNDAPPSPSKLAPGTPPSLSRSIQRMMSKRPEDRPSLTEIRQVIAELREPKAAPVAEKKSGRAISVLIGFLLFLCGVITLGVIGLIKKHDDAQPTAAPAADVGSGSAAGSASVAGSAASAAGSGSAVAEAPTNLPGDQPQTIEFEDDKVEKRKPKPQTQTDDDELGSGSAVDDLPVKPRPGIVLLMLDVSSQIELDGKVMSADSKGGKFEVLPGQHTVRVTAPGRQPVTRTVDVEAGATAVMRIGDDTAPSQTPDKPADKPVDRPADKPAEGSAAPATDPSAPSP